MTTTTMIGFDINKVMEEMVLQINVVGAKEFGVAMEAFVEKVKAAAEDLPLQVEVLINGPIVKPRCRHSVDGAPPIAYDVNDKEFDHDVGARLRVRLDGKKIDSVIAYDVEAGWVEHRSKGLEESWSVRKRSTGTVTVKWRD